MKFKCLMMACALLATSVAAGCAPTKAPAPRAQVPAGYESLRMLGGSLGSATTVTVMALAALFSKYYPQIEWSSTSSGTAVNPIYLTKGTAKLAMVLPSGYIDGYGYEKVRESRLRSISLPTAPVYYFFLVPEDKPWSDITQVPKGTNFNPGAAGTTAVVCAEAWLKLAGLSKKDFNWLPMGGSERSDAWRAGKIDVIMLSTAGVAPWLMDMYTSPRKFKPMGLTPEQAARATAEKTFEQIGFTAPAKGMLSQIIPEMFKDDVVGTQTPNFLSSRDDFPDEIAYKMARILDEHRADLIQLYPATKFGATPQSHIPLARPPLDIHPGVAKYYREKGYLK